MATGFMVGSPSSTLGLGRDAAGLPHEFDQYVEGTCADLYGLAVALEKPRRGK